MASTPSTQASYSFTHSATLPGMIANEGSSSWIKSAPRWTNDLSSSLITLVKSQASSSLSVYPSPGLMCMVRVSGPGQVALMGLSVWALVYSNSSTIPSPLGTVTFCVVW